MKNFITSLIAVFLSGIIAESRAQDSFKRTYLGLSIQFYPAGIIPTFNLERYLRENTSFLFRLGANIADRQDFSD